MKRATFTAGLSILLLCALPARGETAADEEAPYRAEALRSLPKNAARRLFSIPSTPAEGPAQAIGAHRRGCLAGALPLAPEGPGWQVHPLSRDRSFGHPALVAWIHALAAATQKDGLPELLIGDMAQPRGGPMLTGHASHQLGLEADIWLSPVDLVQPDLLEVNADFTQAHLALLRRAALMPGVDRIFVNAAIKKAACRDAAGAAERGWLRKLRPWPGHNYHLHVALECTGAACAARNPVPRGDGCGKELAHWFREDVRFPKRHPPPARILMLKDLPGACRQVLASP